ncbi:hypothetical protein H8356DRAFT_1332902 [Neocallimastix lanati (nom. inval.)]|nr:hypothetical protein H8356DRAFT_1332902 [Neocallimastix sp. JGI-2020a]
MKYQIKREDNRASSLNVKDFHCILCHIFSAKKDLSLSKVNMKDILYMPLYTTGFFSMIY